MKYKFGDWVETPRGIGRVLIVVYDGCNVGFEDGSSCYFPFEDIKPAKQPLLDFIRQHNIREARKYRVFGWCFRDGNNRFIRLVHFQIEFPTDTDIVVNEDWRSE